MMDENAAQEKDVSENVRLQNLRDFTVQIRHIETDVIVGTGIVISLDGGIITCAHVVEAAGVNPRKPKTSPTLLEKIIRKFLNRTPQTSNHIAVYFPQVHEGENKKRTAVVCKYFRDYDDDIVLLQLTDGASPLAPEQIAELGTADKSEGNLFRTYGYSSIGNYPAARGDGVILGSVEAPPDQNLQVDPVQLKSRDIAKGMSGAAVLDVNRNLVVGLVAERYYPKGAVQDEIGYGIDSKVLTFDPFDFVLRGEALELKPAPELKLDKDLHQQAIEIVEYVRKHRKPEDRFSWNAAPTVLPEWTGRDELLAEITKDWNDPKKHVTGLIGFGGEGKSSLARKWVETLERSNVSTFDGLFWWGFYENRSIDEFLEAALNFLSGGRVDTRQVPSSSLRAQIIGAMLGAGRYLFVLDGLEVLQHQEGDQYGLLTSNDLRDLLTYFARPDIQSFCLITSRAPVLDLMDYTTYTHRDVERLSEADGVALLEKLGVKGSKSQLGKVVADWDGHALTISLLGSYLAEKYNGDIAHLADIPIPTADEPRYERVHRVLRRYDEHLTAAEREFSKLFSAFRTPVHESAFEKVFQPLLSSFFFPDDERGKTKEEALRAAVDRLVNYKILHCDTTSQTYTAHPLVRNHYLAYLTRDTGAHDTHLKIKDYYLSLAGGTPQYPTLDDLKPLIEVVHHACQAGAYDEAIKIYDERISQKEKYAILHQLGAYDTALSILFEFFSKGQKYPAVSVEGYKRLILGTMGLCLMSLGRLREAIPIDELHNDVCMKMQDWRNASRGYGNLAELHAQLGALEASAEAARQALDLARKAEDKMQETNSLSYQAWANHLLGNMELAGNLFSEAERLNRKVYSNNGYLHSLMGIGHAIYLHRKGDFEYALRVNKANLRDRELGHKVNQLSDCYRILGDLDFASGNPESARVHYESALKIARSISFRPALIEALLARGRFLAKMNVGVGSPDPRYGKNNIGRGDPAPTVNDAFTDLNEALTYAVEGGYRRYEVDIRVALAWAHLAAHRQHLHSTQVQVSSTVNGLVSANAEATRALQMSEEMGYHWGKVDAKEVLEKIARSK